MDAGGSKDERETKDHLEKDCREDKAGWKSWNVAKAAARNRELLGSLSTRVFETQTVTGSELFSVLTCPHTTTFTLLSIFSPL